MMMNYYEYFESFCSFLMIKIKHIIMMIDQLVSMLRLQTLNDIIFHFPFFIIYFNYKYASNL
jgi:hypothetical protein